MGVKVRVWGDYALFTKPEFKSERMSYDVMTPGAARGILDAIYWHPGMRWVIDRIHVLKPIKRISVMTNELKYFGKSHAIASALNHRGISEMSRSIMQERIQRRNFILKDVEYIIEAHFEFTEGAKCEDRDPGKILSIMENRVKKGSCFQTPFLGSRDYAAFFGSVDSIPECPVELIGRKKLGSMHYDFIFDGDLPKPLFFDAVMVDGVIDVPPFREVVRKAHDIGGADKAV